MFDIEYKGGNTVVIATKKSKLITDPKQSVVGLKDIEPKQMVALATEARFAVHSDDSLLEIESPGEYEVGDFSVRGVAAQRHLDSAGHNGTMYRVEVGDVHDRVDQVGLAQGVDGHFRVVGTVFGEQDGADVSHGPKVPWRVLHWKEG